MRKVRLNLAGERYGNLVVIKEANSIYNDSGKMIRRWECQCDCGRKTIVRHGDLRNGRTTSCGCLKKKRFVHKTHGYSRTKLGMVYTSMRQRCNNPNNKNYDKYGGRGIRVCEEWEKNPESFFEWALNNGYKEGLSIDRIDVNGNYCPENCRWTDWEVQAINQRTRKDNKTGYKGIYFSQGSYRVQVRRNKKTYYFGSYKRLEDAIKALNEAKKMVDEAQPKEDTLFNKFQEE